MRKQYITWALEQALERMILKEDTFGVNMNKSGIDTNYYKDLGEEPLERSLKHTIIRRPKW